METIIHFAVILKPAEPHIDQLEGVTPNKSHGAVTPVKAVSGKNQFACCVDDGPAKAAGLCMTKHAGKTYEGANHAASGDAQFVNCPFCKDTTQYKEAMEDHERHTAADRGLFAGIFDKQRASMQGGASGAVASPASPDVTAKIDVTGEVLPVGNKG